MNLQEFLLGLASGAFTVPLLQYIVNTGYIPASRFNKIVLSFVLPILLSLIGLVGLMYFGYMEMPLEAESWFALLWPVFATAYVTAQGLYKWLTDRWGILTNGK